MGGDWKQSMELSILHSSLLIPASGQILMPKLAYDGPCSSWDVTPGALDDKIRRGAQTVEDFPRNAGNVKAS